MRVNAIRPFSSAVKLRKSAVIRQLTVRDSAGLFDFYPSFEKFEQEIKVESLAFRPHPASPRPQV